MTFITTATITGKIEPERLKRIKDDHAIKMPHQKISSINDIGVAFIICGVTDTNHMAKISTLIAANTIVEIVACRLMFCLFTIGFSAWVDCC